MLYLLFVNTMQFDLHLFQRNEYAISSFIAEKSIVKTLFTLFSGRVTCPCSMLEEVSPPLPWFSLDKLTQPIKSA